MDEHRRLLDENVAIAERWSGYRRIYSGVRELKFPPLYRDQITEFVPPSFSSPDSRSIPEPLTWEAMAPASPGWVSRMFGGQARYEQAVVEAKSSAAMRLDTHKRAEDKRRASVGRHLVEYHALCEVLADLHQQATRELLLVDELMLANDPTAIVRHFESLLGLIDGPFGKIFVSEVRYLVDTKRLIIDIEIPGWYQFEGPKEHKFIKSRNEFKTVMRSDAEVTAAYRDAIADLVAGTLHVVFAGDRYSQVDSAIIHAEMPLSVVSAELTGKALFGSIGASKAHFASMDSPHAAVVLLGLTGKASSGVRSFRSVSRLLDDAVLV
ncbi:hypothetical protein [Arthrobacter sp. HLT1-21]